MLRKTRLAPSPTGALHLGNARTFVLNWLLARQRGWRIVLRIEDLDSPRVKPGADRQAMEDLRWLGLDWDEPADPQRAYTQREDLSAYRQALWILGEQGLLYPCRCTRAQIENALSAPHADEHELRYPGTCRPDGIAASAIPSEAELSVLLQMGRPRSTALRVYVPQEVIGFTDQIHGKVDCDVQQQVGDFVVLSKLGFPAYQLAVVVDDARQGVTDVVRGDDLLASTARQLLLYRLLKWPSPPSYWHVPLVLGPDGRRLAKRHGDSRLAHYRQQGVPSEKIIGLLAFWSGMLTRRQPLKLADWLQGFDLEKLPRTPVWFTPEDHQWLLDSP